MYTRNKKRQLRKYMTVPHKLVNMRHWMSILKQLQKKDF